MKKKVENRWRKGGGRQERGGEERENGNIKMKNGVLGEVGLAMSSQRLTLGKFGDNGSKKWIMSKKGSEKGLFEVKLTQTKRKENLPLYGNVWTAKGVLTF